jgi:hypothetical protein
MVQHLLAVRHMKVPVIGHGGIDMGREDRDAIAYPDSMSG